MTSSKKGLGTRGWGLGSHDSVGRFPHGFRLISPAGSSSPQSQTSCSQSLVPSPQPLADVPATVHVDRLPGDVTVARQHDGHVGHFLEGAEAAHGNEVRAGLGIEATISV